MASGKIIQDGDFRYIVNGNGTTVLLLLHGLFGATGNFESLQSHFSKSYKVVTPLLPIMELPLKKLSLQGLVDYIHDFVTKQNFSSLNVIGNSLGGHLAQLFTLQYPELVSSVTLTGSSGLFESTMGSTFPKRGDYEFVKKKAQSTFYDASLATKEVVDEVFETVNNRSKAIRVVMTAKSAIRNNLEDKIHKITKPVLLVWGKQDNITPSWVGEKFHSLLPNSELVLLDECGHAPMMEKPDKFNVILENFLKTIAHKATIKVQ